MELTYGAGRIDRQVSDVEELLREWRVRERDYGQLYLEHKPFTPRDQLLVEDLAATMLVNSRVAAPAGGRWLRTGGSSAPLRRSP
jgi:hypothetical protein